MGNTLRHMAADAAGLLRYGRNAPLKNQVVWIDPTSIETALDTDHPGFWQTVLGDSARASDPAASAKLARRKFRTNPAMVVSNDFDLFTRPLLEMETFRRMHRKFAENLSWQEAGFYDWMMDRIARDGSFDECGNFDEVVARYENLDRLAGALKSGAGLSSPAGIFGRYGSIDGIVVAIGRTGKVVFCGKGNHRLAIARETGCNLIPVSVCAVHAGAVGSGAWKERLAVRGP